MGLNPAYTPMVYSTNPANLNAAVRSTRTVEIGFNFATGTFLKEKGTTSSQLLTPKPIDLSDVDELTRKLEQLTINYANLTTALLV